MCIFLSKIIDIFMNDIYHCDYQLFVWLTFAEVSQLCAFFHVLALTKWNVSDHEAVDKSK